jgi:Domain of unknown function (DUF4382)
MNTRSPAGLIVAFAGLACALAGCSARTDMSVTANTPAQYSHVWITTQEIWFNTSAIAGPDDSGWEKFPLSTPATVDLVAESGGNLGSIVTGLNILPGTYSQVRLIPVDATAALTTSASTAGALYNSEADYIDSAGVTHQLPLEFLNPDKGIGIAADLRVPVGNVGAALGGTSTASTTTTDTTTNGSTFGTTNGTSTGTILGAADTTAATTGSTVGSTTATTTPNQFTFSIDGTHDLVPFAYTIDSGLTSGVMLSSHAAAYDLTQSGGISGTLTLTNLTTSTSSTTGLPNIQASAQVLSADGTRHVVVTTTTVGSDGSFLLYPLPTNSSLPAYYDVVIHGPGIATIIIKSVQVPLSTAANVLASTDTTATTATTDTTGTTTAATTATNTSVNPVSIGTFTPRAATAFTANLATSPAATLPAGSTLGFYQTLARSGEVPYVIEWSPLDPLNEVLFTAQGLSGGTIDSGTWATSGGAINVVSAAPAEGAGAYIAAPSAPGYAESVLTTLVKAPAASTTTTTTTTTPAPVTFVAPTLPLAAGAASGTVTATVTQATAGKYSSGELLVSYNGALVAAVQLGSAFASGSASVTVNDLPAQTSAAAYYVTVRTWTAAGAVTRTYYPSIVDLRGSASASISVTVN